jgi:hypothetical protein
MRLRADARGPTLRAMRRLRGSASGSRAGGSGATHRSSTGGISASCCCCCWGCGLAEPPRAPWLLQASRRMRLWPPARPPCCCCWWCWSSPASGPSVGDELRLEPLAANLLSSSRLRTLRARPLLCQAATRSNTQQHAANTQQHAATCRNTQQKHNRTCKQCVATCTQHGTNPNTSLEGYNPCLTSCTPCVATLLYLQQPNACCTPLCVKHTRHSPEGPGTRDQVQCCRPAAHPPLLTAHPAGAKYLAAQQPAAAQSAHPAAPHPQQQLQLLARTQGAADRTQVLLGSHPGQALCTAGGPRLLLLLHRTPSWWSVPGWAHRAGLP